MGRRVESTCWGWHWFNRWTTRNGILKVYKSQRDRFGIDLNEILAGQTIAIVIRSAVGWGEFLLFVH